MRTRKTLPPEPPPAATGRKPRQALSKGKVAKNESSRTPATTGAPGEGHSDPGPFCIVGIGASAGGLEAFQQLLNGLPTDTGMAFVLVSHLDPKRESLLTEILARSTRMPTIEVKDRLAVLPDRIYVIPANSRMTIVKGVLRLLPRSTLREPHHPIDHFLRSLAEDRGDRSIGVVLSGLDGDGTRGLEAIKGQGGITFAQDESATYDSMPHSAVEAGVVDFVLSPAGIAEEIARIACHPYVTSPKTESLPPVAPEPGTDFENILETLYHASGVDFSGYKPNTIERRIARRMAVNRIGEIDQYAAYIRERSDEVVALYQDLLIGVTSFFRDSDAFEVLKTSVVPEILKSRGPHEPMRIWVLGCSTGEEAYSIAMTLQEVLGDAERHTPIQLYATDLNELSIEKARKGLFPRSIAREVSPERLQRFFVETDGGYQVCKPLRDLCVFARHNVLTDPPFARMNLVSFRNVLIYLKPDLQKRILPALHYALRPNGFLLLGASESITGFADLFTTVDKKHKIYSKKPGSTRPGFFAARSTEEARPVLDSKGTQPGVGVKAGFDAPREADRLLLGRYAPAAVLVDSNLEILQFRESTGAYLVPASGKATLNVLKMAREGLLGPMRTAIQKVIKTGKPVRRDGVRVTADGRSLEITLEVMPITPPSGGEPYLLIVFEPTSSRVAGPARSASRDETPLGERPDAQRATDLEEELVATRDYLQSVVEQYEAANEELQAAGEEMQSSNEEMQSINEELETGKEETQSANEELLTVNDELQSKNEELSLLNIELNRVELERSLLFEVAEEARRTAQAANHTKDVFLATVSHELRTPLNAMLGWAHILRAGPASEEITTRAVETIERNAKAQAKIIDDLMDIARIISGKLSIEAALVDLASVVEAAVETLRPTAAAQGVTLEIMPGPAACPVLGDADRLRQVVWNLTTNAIKFTQRGGRVEVRLARAGAEATLTVSDTGRGIDVDVISGIFDQFRQADTELDARHGGLGLGLTIVRSLVELHGGTVRAESAGRGKGAIFTVVIPVVDASRDGVANGTELDDSPTLAGVRVLVVDDHADAREMLAVGLAQYGADVRTSPSAADALRELKRWRPQVLVSDIGMMGEDGYVLISKVRALGTQGGGTLLAIALTGYVTAEDQRKAIAAGFDLHWPKPVDLLALINAIANLLAPQNVQRDGRGMQ